VKGVGVFDYYRSIEAPRTPTRSTTPSTKIFRVNVKSHLRAVKAALPELKRLRPAGFVLLTESASLLLPRPRWRAVRVVEVRRAGSG